MNQDMSMLHVIGDASVLVMLADRGHTLEQMDALRRRLKERFPTLEFTFIEGATGLMVHQDAAEEAKA